MSSARPGSRSRGRRRGRSGRQGQRLRSWMRGCRRCRHRKWRSWRRQPWKWQRQSWRWRSHSRTHKCPSHSSHRRRKLRCSRPRPSGQALRRRHGPRRRGRHAQCRVPRFLPRPAQRRHLVSAPGSRSSWHFRLGLHLAPSSRTQLTSLTCGRSMSTSGLSRGGSVLRSTGSCGQETRCLAPSPSTSRRSPPPRTPRRSRRG
mmetsp:Transcript_56579/g.168359  ORF Transcript_56579/g.168359 Transcript_56579/m.168359 type:complete len:202 (+) Transcript_56579:105-710(+)